MYCVDCGEEKDIFREGSCLECYLKNHQFTKGPDSFTIPFCPHCGTYKYKNNWQTDPFDQVLQRYIKQAFTISNELKNQTISIQCQEKEQLLLCAVKIKGTIDNVPITEEHKIQVRIKNHACDLCSKQFGGYHEAIIQIRSGTKKMKQDQINDIQLFVESIIDQMFKKGNKKLFLTDIGYEPSGIDFFISDKQAAYTITKKAQEHYGGTITTSSKNIGMKDGKQLYRYTYLLRFTPFEPHDIIKHQKQFFYVSKIVSTSIHLIDLIDWKEVIIDASELEHAMVIGNKNLIKDMILVSQTSEDIQVMDQENYTMKVIKKPVNKHFGNDTISIIYINEEHIYLTPF